MTKINLYQFGVYEPESGNGVHEFMYQYSHLLKDHIQIHFVNFCLSEPEGYHLKIEDGVRIHSFGKLKGKGLFFPPAFSKWLDTIAENEHAIFHLHSVFRLSNFTLSRLLKRRAIPYVFTPHDSYSPESLKGNYFLKRIFLKTFEKHILDNARVVHAITSYGVQNIAEFTKNEIQLVTNFVKDQTPHYEEPIALPRSKSICFIGRIAVYQKGIDYQLKAYQQFRQNTQSEVPFTLIGRHSAQDREEVDGLLRDCHLDQVPEVQLTGRVTDEEKFARLQEAYVYLQLSRYEGFGLSIVEALSFGKPVIVSRNVPIRDQILKCKAGFVVNDHQEAAQALEKIFNMSPAEYLQMAENARACYLNHFHPDIIKPQLLRLYEQVVPPLPSEMEYSEAGVE